MSYHNPRWKEQSVARIHCTAMISSHICNLASHKSSFLLRAKLTLWSDLETCERLPAAWKMALPMFGESYACTSISIVYQKTSWLQLNQSQKIHSKSRGWGGSSTLDLDIYRNLFLLRSTIVRDVEKSFAHLQIFANSSKCKLWLQWLSSLSFYLFGIIGMKIARQANEFANEVAIAAARRKVGSSLKSTLINCVQYDLRKGKT